MLINENKLIPVNEIKYSTETHSTALNTLMQKIRTAKTELHLQKLTLVLFKIRVCNCTHSKIFFQY